MKNTILSILLLLVVINTYAQVVQNQERTTIIASLDNGDASFEEFDLTSLKIESKIAWILKLNEGQITLENPQLVFDQLSGWYLQYKFNIEDRAGAYRENLTQKNNQLIITEGRNAQMAVATNCETLIFTSEVNTCECTEKINESEEAVITYRLFTSLN